MVSALEIIETATDMKDSGKIHLNTAKEQIHMLTETCSSDVLSTESHKARVLLNGRMVTCTSVSSRMEKDMARVAGRKLTTNNNTQVSTKMT